jgi:hypothetical protein
MLQLKSKYKFTANQAQRLASAMATQPARMDPAGVFSDVTPGFIIKS